MTDAGANRSVYAEAGVDTAAAASALGELLSSVKRTFALRSGVGRPLLPIGYFANVLDLGSGTGLAISTDGVGTKILIAQLLDKYDTIGIDCVAMNVNDVICVGAEPIAMVDYLGVQVPDPSLFRELGKGLLKGAELSGICIPGGEVAQVAEMIRGVRDGRAFDLVGTCVGLVPAEKVLSGQGLEGGDVLVGLASSGIHSNGLTLARNVLLDSGRLAPTDYVAEFGRTLGEELLEPTTIYVAFATAALRANLRVKAFIHITGDGLLNLTRVSAPVGFEIEALLEVPPIFDVIQRVGAVPDEEMFRVFNMGIGLCAAVAGEDASALVELAQRHGHRATVIGGVRADETKSVRVLPRNLIGRGTTFSRT
jgi:phosphoribosylformylglycinamidine cyclo-ligase